MTWMSSFWQILSASFPSFSQFFQLYMSVTPSGNNILQHTSKTTSIRVVKGPKQPTDPRCSPRSGCSFCFHLGVA